MRRDLPVHQRLLLAAVALEESGKTPFSAEDLVVAAWRLFPDTFGLAGYADADGRPMYPNSNRVFMEIMGSSKPIRRLGLLAKSGTKTFRLTERGRQTAVSLRAQTDGEARAVKATFSRETKRELQKLLSSRAVAKHLSDQGEEVTFHDAASFWGISARSSANELRSRLADVEGVLNAAAEAASGRPIVLEHGSQPYRRADILGLLEFHNEMLDRFNTDLAVIRKRTDERL